MKKILIILGLILAFLLTIGGCNIETSTETSFGLTIEDSDFVYIVPEQDGRIRLVPRGNSTFEKGEKVNFVLLNVGKFKRGDDGLNWFDMDMEIKDANGNILSSYQGLMGEGGHTDLLDNIAATPYGYFTAVMEPGNYKVTLIVYDKISGGSASKTKSFTVVE